MNKDNDHIHAVPNGRKQAELPALLQQVKENSISILLAHLENLFSTCDDLFFDLSSRAASNAEQNLYFESMREVRLKKNGVNVAFKTELESAFYQLLSSPPKSQQAELDPTHNNLSLVQNDALEQDVAISSMVTKARANCQENLYHLNLRFDYLIPNASITEQNNPMDPQQICRYFARACQVLDLNIKARIILYKQFDRFVASKLATVYSSANNLLIEAGVLPKAKGHHQQTNNNRQSAPHETSQEQTEKHLELEFAQLSELFDSIRMQSPEILAGIIPHYTAYSSNAGPALSNQELLQLLTNSQQAFTPSAQELQLAENLRQVISDILSNQGKQPDRAVQQPDDDVINLVAMFFDFVLDDKSLPVVVQALISRLQIPVLKIALRDKTFFSNSNHPARKLINTIASASIGWDDSTQIEKDRMYALVAKITQEINEQYADNDQIFALKHAELESFIARTEHKSALVEKRTGQAAEGQAKTKLAKTMSQQVILQKLEAVSLPEIISDFLTSKWLSYLIITHLKHGDESTEWVDAIQLIDDLTWASQQHHDAKSLQRFEKIKPLLLERIAKGINQITDTSENATNIMQSIKNTLEQLHSDASSDLINRPLSAEQARDLGHTPGGGSKSWKEMTGIERQQARYKQLTYEFIRKAEQLPINSWISYADTKSGKNLRCKLVSRIEQTDTYVFVNRYGFKTLEKQRKDFACDLQAGRASIIENGQLFDRAMSNVINQLSKIGNPQSNN